ncbi:hypothetical protein WJX72_007881 [[Myrmecia] bisecta]|uniref:Uncharacterized protein n=1 Tax=[Myrmecia] bisecta TaxID=41462 RepID=A0AAW1QSN5_9CHLO
MTTRFPKKTANGDSRVTKAAPIVKASAGVSPVSSGTAQTSSKENNNLAAELSDVAGSSPPESPTSQGDAARGLVSPDDWLICGASEAAASVCNDPDFPDNENCASG